MKFSNRKLDNNSYISGGNFIFIFLKKKFHNIYLFAPKNKSLHFSSTESM